MQKKNKLVALVFMFIFVINVFSKVIYAVNLPDFATIESSNKNVSVYTEQRRYKTAESSVETAAVPTFNFKSESQILMEASNGEVIYANNENERLLPASVTKIMTILLVMDKIDSGGLRYTDTVTCSAAASKMGGSQIWFKEGETLTIDEALKCICVVSANDVCYAVAELIGGSHENFVQMMNDKAKSLGMENTHFMNAHGIDEDGHYTTAKDIAIMSKELITKHPDIIKYTTIWMDSIRGGKFGLSNTNKLLKTYNGLTGLKTGSTSKAMFNLSATAKRDNLNLIAVVLKAPTSAIRNEEVTTLLNYGFSNYSSKVLGKKGEVLESININKNIKDKVDIVFEKDECLILKKGDNVNYTKVVELEKGIKAPIEENKIVGKVKFIDEKNNIIREANLVINKNIERSNFLDYLKNIVRNYEICGLKNLT